MLCYYKSTDDSLFYKDLFCDLMLMYVFVMVSIPESSSVAGIGLRAETFSGLMKLHKSLPSMFQKRD